MPVLSLPVLLIDTSVLVNFLRIDRIWMRVADTQAMCQADPIEERCPDDPEARGKLAEPVFGDDERNHERSRDQC